MKKTFNLIGGLVISSVLLVVSCQKSTTAADDSVAQSQNASDDARVNSELENVSNEANTAVSLSGASSFAGAKLENVAVTGINAIGADGKITYDTTNGNSAITITYDSITANLLTVRSGSITINFPGYRNGLRWKDKNATIYITFNNYRVTRLSDLSSIVFNGTKSITNVTGGLVYELAINSSPIQHKIRSKGLTITFDNGTQRSWSVYENRTWSNIGQTSSIFQVAISSDTTVNGYSNATLWGTTRLGNNFATQLTQQLVTNSSCGWYKPTSGVRVLNGISHAITETFGVDLITGSPVTFNGTCDANEGFEITWTNANNQNKEIILPY